MIYAGIDVNIITHEKALAAGVEAFGLWCWGMCYAQIHETDGRLPRAVVMSAMGEQRRVLRRLIVRLVVSGLWSEWRCGSCRVCVASESGSDRVQVASESRPSQVQVAFESGSDRVQVASDCGSYFTIHNYDKKNQTAEEIRAKKEASAARVRRWREKRNAQSNAPERVTECVRTPPPPPPSSPPDNITRKQKEREAPPQNVTPVTDPVLDVPVPTDSGARYAAAYAAGVSRGKCAPWVWPETKYATWDLGKIIKGHGVDANQKPYRGEQLLRFIEHTAAEFASQVIAAKKAQYYSAFEPRGCLKWLNEADMAEEARRVG